MLVSCAIWEETVFFSADILYGSLSTLCFKCSSFKDKLLN